MEDAVGNRSTLTPRLRDALTAAGLSPERADVEPVSLGNRKGTHIVRLPDREPLVLQTSDDEEALLTEATLLDRLAAATAVPVPAVIGAGCGSGGSYLLTRRVDGENLHYRFSGLSNQEQRTLASSFGAYLGEIHQTLRFDGVGALSVVDGELRAEEVDWRGWLGQYATAAIERLPAEFDDLRGVLTERVTDPAVAADPPVSLFPWDYRPGNALVRDGDLAAVLDWESPLAAAPALSVAKAEYLVADWYVDEPEPLRQAFRDGYREVRPWPDTRPPHRVAAIVGTAVDSHGRVTNPRYPELDRAESVEFHRSAIQEFL